MDTITFCLHLQCSCAALTAVNPLLWRLLGMISLARCLLQAGDVLLLDTGSQFLINHKSDRNFALVAEVANSQPPRFERVVIALVCAVGAIILYIAEVTDLFTSAAAASAIMLLTGCLSGAAARNSVKWDIIVTIAAAFGLSNALESTGMWC